jgi:hypothetical protein
MGPWLQNSVFLGRAVHVRRLRMSLACVVLALSAIGASACGSTSKSSSSHSATANVAASTGLASARSQRDEDNDIDTRGMGSVDPDRDAVILYGRSADSADRRQITGLVKRYYTAAAAGEGAKACTMLNPLTAESFVEDHRPGQGPSSLQGNTCAQVLSKLFKQRHQELLEDVASFRIGVVQLRGNYGLVLAPFLPAREMQLFVYHHGGTWTMDVALDNGSE